MTNKTLLTLAAAGVLLTGSVFVYKDAFADDSSTLPPFMHNFAEKFGLNEDEVGQYMNEQREEHRTEMQAQASKRQQERLQEAVDAGVITQEQANALTAKREENRQQREQARSEHQAEMQAWAEQNGIDLDALHEFIGGPGPKGPGDGMGMGRGMRW